MRAVLIVLPIFLLTAMGWLLRHKGFLSPQTLRENNFILYWFAMPAILLQGILKADMDVLQNPFFVAATWLPYLATLIIVWLTGRYGETRARFSVLALTAIRGNHFFAGVPIVYLAMGDAGVKAATIILAFSLVIMQLLSIGSAQLALFGKPSRDSMKATAIQLLKNPLFMTCLGGGLLVSVGLNHLPEWMNATLRILADISTGMALLALGAGLYLENLVKMIVSVWKIVLFKLIVHPVVTGLILFAFELPKETIQAGVLLAGMPIAINTAIIAQEMNMDTEYCAKGIAVTTLCSMLSLPLWIHVLGLA